jgi:hypothetical protein
LAMGASSGRYFVSTLANKMEFNSICIIEGVFKNIDMLKNYPPRVLPILCIW